MENNIVSFIAEAEQKAAEIRSQAQHEAASLIAGAEAQASQIAKESALTLAKYREKALQEAEERACENYERTLTESRIAAESNSEALLAGTGSHVTEIVGRIAK